MRQSWFQLFAAQGAASDRLAEQTIRAGSPAARLRSVLALAGPLCLWSTSSLLAGEQEVFVSRGAGSPVYSDKPQPGGKALSLPPINVVEPVTVSRDVANPRSAEDAGKPASATPAYRSFRIVSPEDNGSVAANTALFDVRVAVEPPLQLDAGHAIMVSVNGQPVGQRFAASEFTIPPEFWGDTLPPANQRHQLDATIVDRNGVVLEKAAPVTFILRFVSGGYHRPGHGPGYVPGYRPRPPPRPEPLPIEKPKPPPAQPFDPWERKFEQQGLRFYDRPEPAARGPGR